MLKNFALQANNEDSFNFGCFKQNRIVYICFTILCILSTISSIFAIINFLLCIYIVMVKPKNMVVPFLVYGTFFATLCKILSLTEMSLFTIVMLVYILRLLFQKFFLRKTFLVEFLILLCFLIFIQFVNGFFELNRNIKFFANLIYLYLIIEDMNFSSEKTSFLINDIFIAFIMGIVFSSITRLLDGSIFNVSEFVFDSAIRSNINLTDYTRFSGLYGDPNYYAINVILAMCVLTILLYCKKIRTLPFIALEILLTIFAIMTRSKSALLMLAVPLLYLFYVNRKNKKYFFQIFSIVSIVIIILLSVNGRINWFTSITARFSGNNDLNTLTTGRYSIWISYLDFLKENPLKFLFGVGLSTPILSVGGAHNTYLDICYFLGLVPGILFIILIINIATFRSISFKRNILNYSAIFVVTIMYSFLSCLFDIDLCTNLLLMITIFNYPMCNNLQNI